MTLVIKAQEVFFSSSGNVHSTPLNANLKLCWNWERKKKVAMVSLLWSYIIFGMVKELLKWSYIIFGMVKELLNGLRSFLVWSRKCSS